MEEEKHENTEIEKIRKEGINENKGKKEKVVEERRNQWKTKKSK